MLLKLTEGQLTRTESSDPVHPIRRGYEIHDRRDDHPSLFIENCLNTFVPELISIPRNQRAALITEDSLNRLNYEGTK
jgi:hypothetical protein